MSTGCKSTPTEEKALFFFLESLCDLQDSKVTMTRGFLGYLEKKIGHRATDRVGDHLKGGGEPFGKSENPPLLTFLGVVAIEKKNALPQENIKKLPRLCLVLCTEVQKKVNMSLLSAKILKKIRK